MEIAGGKKPKLSLDDYAAFFDDLNRDRLVVEQLNKISIIHGFSRHSRCIKANMLKAVSSLDLISPRRSTISEKPNPIICVKQLKEVHMSVEEVKQSLESIGWEECAVKSVLAVGSRPADPPSDDVSGISSSSLAITDNGSSKEKVKCGSENPSAAAEMKKKRKRRQKTAGTDQMELTLAEVKKLASAKPLAELEKAMMLEFPVAERPESQLML